jgi:hypothetical protein
MAVIAALGLVIGLFDTPAAAQSDRALRAENETLRTQVKDLQAELEAAMAKIQQLQARIAQLEGQLDTSAAGAASKPADIPPPKPIEVSIDESVPHASPRALLSALKKSYEDELGGLEMGTPDSRQHTAYMRALDSWIAKANRQFRTQIQWHVDLLEARQLRRGFAVQTAAVDPVTHARLGDPFWTVVPRALARRLDQLMQRSHGPYVMRGVLTPEVRVNLARAQVGMFDHPPLIGPYAEFVFIVDASSITAPQESDDDKEAPASTP